jgi:acetyltransferase-like isoleucine patch superfamily enzyme
MNRIHESSVIYPGVKLGDDLTIGPLCVIGQSAFEDAAPTSIGDSCTVGTLTQIHAGAVLSDNVECLGGVFISEDNNIGSATRIGPASVLRYGNRIGKNVRIHSQAFLERVILHDNVFIGPHVVFSDDPHPPCPDFQRCVSETVVEEYVSIGANVTIVPGVKIGSRSLIYAGSVIVKDVPPDSVMAGVPAKRIKDVGDLECPPGFHKRPYGWLDGDAG